MLVLVADDDRAVRESLERALQLAGYEVDWTGRYHGTTPAVVRPGTTKAPLLALKLAVRTTASVDAARIGCSVNDQPIIELAV